ncbi:MAG: PASTA domain-containing protein [Bacteroidetes bacterium]|nr:MAG: PASTA domain-containing protein [Bacteroidota bacterium]
MDLLRKLKSYVWTKSFLKKLGIVVLSYLLIITIIVFYLDSYTDHGQKIKVPNVKGMHFDKAELLLSDLDLTCEVLDSIYDPSKPEGTILDQDPMATDISDVFVKEGRIIRVRVSKKTRLVEMPSLVDKSQRFAESILKNRGLKYRIQFKPTKEANGAVLGQLYKGREIKEGIRIPIGATITLVVGKNEESEPSDIPNLVGLTIFEAKERLASMGNFGFFPVCPDCITYEDSLAARIQSQSPEFLEGVQIPGNSTITVYASKGL